MTLVVWHCNRHRGMREVSLQSGCLVAVSEGGRWVLWEAPGGDVWHRATVENDDVSVRPDEMVDSWGTDKEPLVDGEVVRTFWHSWRSHRLQSSTEKAARWRRNHFNFSHLSYSGKQTHIHTHTSQNTRSYTHGRRASPNTDSRKENKPRLLAPTWKTTFRVWVKETFWQTAVCQRSRDNTILLVSSDTSINVTGKTFYLISFKNKDNLRF